MIEVVDCSIITGHREQAAQDAAVFSGKSRTPWPMSKHNSIPSRAVDVAPYPLDWSDIPAFHALNDVVQDAAQDLGIKIRWGGTFTHLKDYDHWELEDGET